MLTWQSMSFCVSRRLTYEATFWRVVPEMVFEGCDEGTPISSCFMEWLKTCRVHAILGISSGFFYLGETCPSLIALFTSATKRSKGSLSRMVYLPGLLCSLQWNFSPENSLHSIWTSPVAFSSCDFKILIRMSDTSGESTTFLASILIKPEGVLLLLMELAT